MTIEEIREDLKEIRYYYGMFEVLKLGSKFIPPIQITQKVERYNKAIQNAPVRLYALYVALYINNNTQAVLAEDWGFTNEYIKQLNNKLCKYFKNAFEQKN